MDVDPPASPSTPTMKEKSSDVTPTPKPMQATTTVGQLAWAYVVDGVTRYGLCQAHIQEVERAFRRKGGRVISVRWLLQ